MIKWLKPTATSFRIPVDDAAVSALAQCLGRQFPQRLPGVLGTKFAGLQRNRDPAVFTTGHHNQPTMRTLQLTYSDTGIQRSDESGTVAEYLLLVQGFPKPEPTRYVRSLQEFRRPPERCARLPARPHRLQDFKSLTKTVIETALDEEMPEQLGYDRHAVKGRGSAYSHNRTRAKTMLTVAGGVNSIGHRKTLAPRELDAHTPLPGVTAAPGWRVEELPGEKLL